MYEHLEMKEKYSSGFFSFMLARRDTRAAFVCISCYNTQAQTYMETKECKEENERGRKTEIHIL